MLWLKVGERCICKEITWGSLSGGGWNCSFILTVVVATEIYSCVKIHRLLYSTPESQFYCMLILKNNFKNDICKETRCKATVSMPAWCFLTLIIVYVLFSNNISKKLTIGHLLENLLKRHKKTKTQNFFYTTTET